MADFNINHITGKQGQQGTVLAGVTTVSSTGSMRIPSGPTEQRGGRGRGIIAGGSDVTMNYITIASTGNATDFGDTLTNTGQGCAWADSTRGCFNGSDPSHGNSNVIQYVTIQSTGNATDFGDMVSGATKRAGTADATRGVISNGEGSSGKMNQIEYVAIQTLGNASSFGSSTLTTNSRGGCSNGTRGVFGGGEVPSPQTGYNVIDYITIQTTGNATDFGDLIIGRRQTPAGLAGA